VARLANYRVTALLFAATLIVLLGIMSQVFPRELATPIDGANVRSPVLMFEMARTPAHLDAVFGAAGDAERARRIAGMDAGNHVDFLLMPLYGFFTLSFFLATGRELGSGVWRAPGVLGLVAAAADAVENVLLLSITADLADPAVELVWLPYPVWTKFGLLAVTCGAAAVALLRLGRPVLAVICMPAAVMIVPAIVRPLTFGSPATVLIGVAWLAMGAYAIRRAIRPVT
jgi:hypothetical protein